MEPLMTLEEAAVLLRTPVATLRYWRQIGKGPRSGKIGARVFYREREVAAWLEAQFDDDRTAAS